MRSVEADQVIATRAHPGSRSMKWLGVFLITLDGIERPKQCSSLPCNLLGFPNNLSVPIYTPWWKSTPQPFFGMSHNAPPKEMAVHNRTTFLSWNKPITASVSFSRTVSLVETCPIREYFLSLYPVIRDATNEHVVSGLCLGTPKKYRWCLNELCLLL